MRIISADCHICEPPHVFENVPAALRDRTPKMVRGLDGGDGWSFDGAPPKRTFGIEATAGQAAGNLKISGLRFDEIMPGNYNGTAHVADMDIDGIDVSVVYPSSAIFTYVEPDRELALACMRSYNDWVLQEFAGDAPDRIVALPMLPVDDGMDVCVAEFERCQALGAKAMFVPGFPVQPYNSPYFDPLYARAAETGIPLTFHRTFGGKPPDVDFDEVINQQITTAGTVYRFFAAIKPFTYMVMSGVFARHPALKFVGAEVNFGWLPFWAQTMEQNFDIRSAFVDEHTVGTEMRPTDHLGTQPVRHRARRLRRLRSHREVPVPGRHGDVLERLPALGHAVAELAHAHREAQRGCRPGGGREDRVGQRRPRLRGLSALGEWRIPCVTAPPAIVGVGYTDFMKNSGVSTLALALRAIHAACDDAGISFKDLDGVATHRVGDSVQGAVVLNALGMTDPKFYVDQFGGGSASHTVVGQAAMAVATGVADYVVCWRAINARSEYRMGGTGRPPPDVVEFQYQTPYGYATPPQQFASMASAYMAKYGATREDFGRVAIRQRDNASRNERAMMKTPITMDDYLSSRWIVEPLCLFDCCLETDAAIAVVVTSAERARDLKHTPVLVSGAAWGGGHTLYSNHREDLTTTAAAAMSKRLYAMAGVGPTDIDVGCIYDAFTPLVLVQLEDYGFCAKGEAAGVRGARAPVGRARQPARRAPVRGLRARPQPHRRGGRTAARRRRRPSGPGRRGGAVHRAARLRRRHVVGPHPAPRVTNEPDDERKAGTAGRGRAARPVSPIVTRRRGGQSSRAHEFVHQRCDALRYVALAAACDVRRVRDRSSGRGNR